MCRHIESWRPFSFVNKSHSHFIRNQAFKLRPILEVIRMLRPSKLQSASAEGDKGAFKLKPSQLQAFGATSTENNSSGESPLINPFLSVNTSFEEEPVPPATNAPVVVEEKKVDENSDPLSKLTSRALPKSNLFAVKGSISESSGFVFGQNISDRVTGTGKEISPEKDKDGEGGGQQNGELLFRAPVDANSANAIESKEVDGQSLLEATRKYEEKCKVQKRKYEEVETKTGEEDEENVLEINCKIFTFVAGNYEERGRGQLRLNDSKVSSAPQSRVVFRSLGNLRVLINTKVWAGMTVEKPNEKNLRMTAIDAEGHIKVFLVMARPDDIKRLYTLLTERVRIQVERQQEQEELEECPKPPVEVIVEDTESNTETGEPEPKKERVNHGENATAADAQD